MEDRIIKDTLASAKTIAMVGVSSIKKEISTSIKRRPSIIVMKYLQEFGYRVIPVNPFSAGKKIYGETIVPKNKPNLNHSLFNGVRILELVNPKTKKIKDTRIDQILIGSENIKGQRLIIRKTVKNTNPKFLLVPILILLINFIVLKMALFQQDVYNKYDRK